MSVRWGVEKVTTPTRTWPFTWMETLGFILLSLNVITSYREGRHLGFSKELWAYSVGGPLLLVLIVLAVSQIWRAARSRQASVKIAVITLAVTLFPRLVYLAPAAPEKPLPRSLPISEAEAAPLGRRVEALLRAGKVAEVRKLFGANRFEKKVLARMDLAPEVRLGLAEGKVNPMLESILGGLAQGDNPSFVKFYKKGEQPIIQFRHIDAGVVRYCEFYLYKDSTGAVTFDDIHHYNSGPLLSENLAAIFRLIANDRAGVIEQASQRIKAGAPRDALRLLDGLSEKLRNEPTVLSMRIPLLISTDLHQASQLLAKLRERNPNDPVVLFGALWVAVAQDDPLGAAQSIDPIDGAIGGDPYLLPYKSTLLALAGHLREACEVLSELERRYRVDVAGSAGGNLVEELRSSAEFREWLSQRSAYP